MLTAFWASFAATPSITQSAVQLLAQTYRCSSLFSLLLTLQVGAERPPTLHNRTWRFLALESQVVALPSTVSALRTGTTVLQELYKSASGIRVCVRHPHLKTCVMRLSLEWRYDVLRLLQICRRLIKDVRTEMLSNDVQNPRSDKHFQSTIGIQSMTCCCISTR